jgi:hypothetical protein
MLFIFFLPITDYKTVRMKLSVLGALALVLTASVTRTHVPDPIVASLCVETGRWLCGARPGLSCRALRVSESAEASGRTRQLHLVGGSAIAGPDSGGSLYARLCMNFAANACIAATPSGLDAHSSSSSSLAS